MTEFKAGDRIAIYDGFRFTGTVLAIDENGCISTDVGTQSFHPRQCRRLKRVFRKEFWIAQHPCSLPSVHARKLEDLICGSGCKIEWTRVREVKA